MANTYTLIEAKALSSAVNSITFSSIPQTYTSLILKVSIRGTSGSYFTQGVRVTLNGITTGYTTKSLLNVGANSTISGTNPYTTNASVSIFGNNAASTANTFNNAEIYIPNYAGSNDKHFLTDTVTASNSNGGYDNQSGIMASSLSSSTAAITSITLTAQSGEGDFAINSSFDLYGIKNS
jgi:hypothetical protein